LYKKFDFIFINDDNRDRISV